MPNDLLTTLYNPDVLSCLANLSNDEVFTPPSVANQMLDMLPQELFSDPSVTFLDPACKSGVFLREIAKRLIKGLEPIIPDLQQRIDHVFHKQLFAIAITEMTSLLSRRSTYCSKYPNGRYTVSHFDDTEGNIRYKKVQHVWKDGRCVFCGANKEQYDRASDLESHAYEFIHTIRPEEIFNMKFDVIIGNPPYQLSDGGNGTSAKPIYQLFIKQAKRLQPRYLSMIIPARWFSGGKGLDDFRTEMLNDKRIRNLVDFENSAEIFNGVDIAGGICYFLWDRDYSGLCNVLNFNDGIPQTSMRALNEFDTYIRHEEAIHIVRKVQSVHKGQFLDSVVFARKPFGISTNNEPAITGIPCWYIQRIGLKYARPQDVSDPNGILDKWKFLVPKAPIAGQTDFSKPIAFYYDGNTRIASPGQCCTESWLVAFAADTREEIESFKSYLFTKIARFLLLQTVISQNTSKKNFCFIPNLSPYKGEYNDKMLCELWGITDDEWAFIESKIRDVD